MENVCAGGDSPSIAFDESRGYGNAVPLLVTPCEGPGRSMTAAASSVTCTRSLQGQGGCAHDVYVNQTSRDDGRLVWKIAPVETDVEAAGRKIKTREVVARRASDINQIILMP